MHIGLMAFRNNLAAIAAAAGTLLLCASVNTAQAQATRYENGATVSARLGGDWDTFDPQQFVALFGNRLQIMTYDRLTYNDLLGEVKPYLAKSWSVTPSSIAFTLRDDATCPDGTKVTPGLVQRSFQRMIDVKSPNLSRLFGPGPHKLSSNDKAGTFTWVTEKAFGGLLWGFGTGYAGIVCPSGLDNPAAMRERPAGSGPYHVEAATHGEQITLKLRKDWKWGPKGITSDTPGLPDRIVFKVITNDTTAANLVTTGGLDVTNIFGPDADRVLADKSVKSVAAYLEGIVIPAMFNEAPGHVTADPIVRKALYTAIDSAGWIQTAYGGHGRAITGGFLSKEAKCFNPETERLAPKPGVEAARKVLVDAGWKLGSDGKLQKDGQKLNVVVLGYPAQNQGPEYVVSQFNKMGAVATLKSTDYATWTKNYQTGAFDLWIAEIFGTYPYQLITYMSGTFPEQGGANFAKINDPELDAAVTAARAATGDDACKNWGKVQEAFIKGYHVVPMGLREHLLFTSPRVELAAPGERYLPTEPATLDVTTLRVLKK